MALFVRFEQFVGLDGLPGQHLYRVHVLLLRRAGCCSYSLAWISVPSPWLANTSPSRPSSSVPLMTCTRGTPPLQASSGVPRLRQHVRREAGTVALEQLTEFVHEHLPNRLAAVDQPSLRGDENQLDGFQLLRDRDRHRVGVDAIGLPVTVEPERRDDRDDALRQQRLQELGIDALDLAGEEMIHALDHADGMRDDHVRAGGAQVVGRQTLENLVGQAVGGRQRQVERRCIGDAGPFEIGGQNLTFVGERSDLLRGAMHEHDTDVQRAEERDVEQQRRDRLSSTTIPASIARMKIFSRNCGMYCRMPRRSVSFTC